MTMHKNDEFQWLEDENSPQVKDWIEKQNAIALGEIKGDFSDAFFSDLQGHFASKMISCPKWVNGHFYFSKREESEERFSIFRTNDLKDSPEKVLDFNEGELANKSLDYWYVSKTGKYVVYGVSDKGTEMATLFIYDVDKKINIDGQRDFCRYSMVAWLPADAGFYYTKNVVTATMPKSEQALHTKLFFHKIDTDFEADPIIFGDFRPKDDMYKLSLSHDGRYLAIHYSNVPSFDHDDVCIFDNNSKTYHQIFSSKSSALLVVFLHQTALLLTTENAPNKKIMQVALGYLTQGRELWTEFVAESKYPMEGLFVTKNKILLRYLVNACAQIKSYDHAGEFIGDLCLEGFTTIQNVSTSIWESNYFYSTESFVDTNEIRYQNDALGTYEIFYKIPNPLNPKNYFVEQVWATSKDGTRVPSFVIRKAGALDKKGNPTILYGYGGFGNSQTPHFIKGMIPWLDRGGIYVIANIRGGGEFGQIWHTAGIKENKVKSFEDFIASAEFLISNGYTTSDKLGIWGGSNGGLLVCAVAMMKPHLFNSVVANVPLTDMARFHLFGMASRWTYEYGNPENPKELKKILTWSPYHNVALNTEYPNFLIVTGENDSRVNPLHARKMTARLQASDTKRQVFLLTEFNAGHGKGKNKSGVIFTHSLILSFFAKNLGLVMNRN